MKKGDRNGGWVDGRKYGRKEEKNDNERKEARSGVKKG